MFYGRASLIGGHVFQEDIHTETCLIEGHVFRLAYHAGGCALLEDMSNRRAGLTGGYVL